MRIRYRLRTLFAFTLTVAVIAFAYGWWRRSSLEQRRAMNAIASKGGFVWYDAFHHTIDIEFERPLHEGCGQTRLWAAPRTNAQRFADADLQLIDKVWRVRNISFANTDVSTQKIDKFRRTHPQCKIIE